MDKKKAIIGGVIILILLVAGYFCYDMVINRKEEKKEEKEAPVQQQQEVVQEYEEQMEHFTEATITDQDGVQEVFKIEDGKFIDTITSNGKSKQEKITGITEPVKYFNYYTVRCDASVNIWLVTESGNVYWGNTAIYKSEPTGYLAFTKSKSSEKIVDLGLTKRIVQGECGTARAIFKSESGKIFEEDSMMNLTEMKVRASLGDAREYETLFSVNTDQTVTFRKTFEKQTDDYAYTEGNVVDENHQALKIKSIIATSNMTQEEKEAFNINLSKAMMYFISSDNKLYSLDNSTISKSTKEAVVKQENDKTVKNIQNLELGYSSVVDYKGFHSYPWTIKDLAGTIVFSDGSTLPLSNIAEAFVLQN